MFFYVLNINIKIYIAFENLYTSSVSSSECIEMNISDIRQVFIRMMALSLLVTGGGTAAATTVAELEEAIKRGDTLEQIVAMFEEGPEVNYKVTLLPGKEPAPLICALADDAVYGYSDEHKGLDLPYNQAEAMTALLDNGADPNARDARGRTPLHLTGHSLAQHVLLQKGADPRLEDNRGNLPVVPEAEGIATEGQGSDSSDEIIGLSPKEIRELGVCYAEGKNGKAVDEAHAIVLYEEAAERGDATAARWMGWRYRQGRGVPKDKALADYFFSLAAAAGDEAAAKQVSDMAPEQVGGMVFQFRCEESRVEAPLPHPEQYNILDPEDSGVYYLAQWPEDSNKFESDSRIDGINGVRLSNTYQKINKNTATVVTEFESVSSDSGNGWYKRSYKLIFTSPTEGKATCTVTGKPTTIGAQSIHYKGTFTLKND